MLNYYNRALTFMIISIHIYIYNIKSVVPRALCTGDLMVLPKQVRKSYTKILVFM